MLETDPLLLEIGTEELPPKELRKLGDVLGEDLLAALKEARLAGESAKSQSFAAPRRLAVVISDVAAKQTDEFVERKGPALSAAFGPDGTPTAAAQGFARSLQVSVAALTTVTTDRGQFLAYRERRKGQALKTVLPALLDNVLRGLPMGRRMRWGETTTEFVRPVHWVVLLHGQRVLRAPILGVTSSRATRGHRFHAPQKIVIPSAEDYSRVLKADGYVLADFEERKTRIREQVEGLAAGIQARALVDPALLELVTALVEWPRAFLGSFDKGFLEVPREALVAAMQDHQKYFPLERDGNLLPQFIAVANIESTDEAVVCRGNERVLAARFADARFFWKNDSKKRLEAHADGLAGVVFQQRLGSMAEKVARLRGLAGRIARLTRSDEALVDRAAQLSKADLLTGMVGEFPELQGIMGGHYARHDGELAAVAEAIAEHYRPRFANDSLPQTDLGQALALADKLDTLVGIFGIGLAPSGDKDPFALRRAAIGALRLLDLMGRRPGCDIAVAALVQEACARYPQGLLTAHTSDAVCDFLVERLRHLLAASYPADAIDAGLAYGMVQVHDSARRIEALALFRQGPDAAALISANKRIRNILRQAPEAQGEAALRLRDTTLSLTLSEAAEIQLAERLRALQPCVAAWVQEGDYHEALVALSGLRPDIDAFFLEVLVMAEDHELRRSRLALLSRLSATFESIGDVSRLKSQGDPDEP